MHTHPLASPTGALFLAAVLAVASGCGSDGNPTGDGGAGDNGTRDATTPSDGDTPTDGDVPSDAEVTDTSLPMNGTLRAFPSAEGFGADATGGRGGQVIHVTNLNAGGAGSLQAAINVAGPRMIVFDVSGHIPDVIVAEHGDFTLAGQTAPGGISVAGLMLQGDSVCESPGCTQPTTYPENFIVRHLHVRVDPNDGDGSGDGVRFHHAVNGIIDHVSIGNATDEAIQIAFSRDITIQHTMLAETIGSHGQYGGMLANYSDSVRGFPMTNLSIHHNLWVRIYGRYPELGRENIADTAVSRVEVSNNVYWGTRHPMYVAVEAPGFSHDVLWELNVVGNLRRDDPHDALSFGLIAIEPPPDLLGVSSLFLSDNRIVGAGVMDYPLIYNNNDFADAIDTMGTPWYSSLPTWSSNARAELPGHHLPRRGRPPRVRAEQRGRLPARPLRRAHGGLPGRQRGGRPQRGGHQRHHGGQPRERPHGSGPLPGGTHRHGWRWHRQHVGDRQRAEPQPGGRRIHHHALRRGAGRGGLHQPRGVSGLARPRA
ncbi:MAG: hypothetical protein IPN77_30640 [Sandaracinaceae bacterium]|nr:hypothetical protein [Sandaracinaceae bacterium]